MKVLVTGGAGYIGSVTVAALVAAGHDVVVVDNLVMGHREAVDPKAKFVHLDLRSTVALTEVLRSHGTETVVHFAAASLVGESVTHPAKYMDNNIGGTLSLLDAMRLAGTKRIVFSSTAATYGEPVEIPIRETHPTLPTNPYGLTKRVMEQIMETYSVAYGMSFVALRYFNACGAAGRLGEDHKPESHLIPLVLQVALGQRASISVFGDDYDTPDGTCVRDYIHVSDLADAHLRAVGYLADGGKPLICNLGNGSGYSVREVIDACRRVSGHAIPEVMSPRRAGDPSRLIAEAALTGQRLGWKPAKGDLNEIVADAWKWHVANPRGYGR